MKNLIILILFSYSLVSAQEVLTNTIELAAGYKLGIPSGDMGVYIRQGHGFYFQGMFKPKPKLPLWIGANFDMLIYSSKTTRQEYVFPDNSVSNVDVNVSSSIYSYQMAFKYVFTDKNLIEPYAMLRMGGTTFSTDLYIEDPRYPDECVALEREHLHKSRTFNITPALGSRVFFNKSKFLFLDFSVGYTLGGDVTFMVPTLGEDMSNPVHDHSNHSNGETQPYLVDFINRRTQVVHKHHVGNIYKSTFQMIQARIGIGICI